MSDESIKIAKDVTTITSGSILITVGLYAIVVLVVHYIQVMRHVTFNNNHPKFSDKGIFYRLRGTFSHGIRFIVPLFMLISFGSIIYGLDFVLPEPDPIEDNVIGVMLRATLPYWGIWVFFVIAFFLSFKWLRLSNDKPEMEKKFIFLKWFFIILNLLVLIYLIGLKMVQYGLIRKDLDVATALGIAHALSQAVVFLVSALILLFSSLRFTYVLKRSIKSTQQYSSSSTCKEDNRDGNETFDDEQSNNDDNDIVVENKTNNNNNNNNNENNNTEESNVNINDNTISASSSRKIKGKELEDNDEEKPESNKNNYIHQSKQNNSTKNEEDLEIRKRKLMKKCLYMTIVWTIGFITVILLIIFLQIMILTLEDEQEKEIWEMIFVVIYILLAALVFAILALVFTPNAVVFRDRYITTADNNDNNDTNQ